MVQWFFLDGIDAKTTRTAVGRQDDLVVFPSAYKAHSSLTFVKLACAWADVALHPAVLEPVPVFGSHYAIHSNTFNRTVIAGLSLANSANGFAQHPLLDGFEASDDE